MSSSSSICGCYVGRKQARPDRHDELSPTEKKELARARNEIHLCLRPDGTFKSDATQGTWTMHGNRLSFTPKTFGGQTSEEMQRMATEMGRVFSLGFLFQPYDLRLEGHSLVTVDENALIYTEYSLVSA